MIDGLIEFLNQLNIFDIVFLIVLIYFITQCFVKGFTLSLIAILYTSLVALMQDDMKKLIAYSSVAHMGLCNIGYFHFHKTGN